MASTLNLEGFLDSKRLTAVQGHIRLTNNADEFYLLGGSEITGNPELSLRGKGLTALPGVWTLFARGENQHTLRGTPDGRLIFDDNDLAGSAIISKSLGSNGYIKYVSGLIIQYAFAYMANAQNSVQINFPISFSETTYKAIVTPVYYSTALHTNHLTLSSVNVYVDTSKAGLTLHYIAIGN